MTWNGNSRECTEYHDIGKWKGGYVFWGIGIPIHLGHNFVRQVTSLQIFNGSDWEEWIGNKTEGRGDDYWINYNEGIIYITQWAIYQGGQEIKVTYTYGRDDLPKQIKELCRLLVVRDLLLMERQWVALPSQDEMPLVRTLDYIERRIGQLEELVKAVHVVVTSAREEYAT